MGGENSKKISKSFSPQPTSHGDKDNEYQQIFKKHTVASGRQNLSEEDFKTIFTLPEAAGGDLLPAALYNKFCNSGGSGGSAPGVSERQFIEHAKHLQGLFTEVDYFMTAFSTYDGNINKENVIQMLETSCVAAYVINGLPITCSDDESRKVISSLADSIIPDVNSSKSTPEVIYYINANLPKLLAPIHMFVIDRLCNRQVAGRSKSEVVCGGSGSLLSPALLWLLSSALPTVYTTPSPQRDDGSSSEEHQQQTRHLAQWHPLYNGDQHGLSLNRFEHHTFSYRSPTVMLIATSNRQLYCAACDVEWREHPKQWGGHHSAVYQILPVFRELESGSDIYYYNTKSRNLTRGLQIGRDPRAPTLFVDTSMDEIKGKYIDTANNTHLTAIEVWGCGSAAAAQDQSQQKAWERRQAEAARKVKNPGAWDENPDKFILGVAGVRVEHNERADTCEVHRHNDTQTASSKLATAKRRVVVGLPQ